MSIYGKAWLERSSQGNQLRKQPNVADHVSRFYEAHGDRINLVPVFGIEVDSDIVTLSDEHCEFKWVTLEEALEHLVWRGQKQGIQVVSEMVLSNDDRMRWSMVKT